MIMAYMPVDRSCLSGCPFYNFSLINHADFRVMVHNPVEGNRCGLVALSHFPCKMEISGQDPDWENCRMRRHEERILRRLADVGVYLQQSGEPIPIRQWVQRFSK